MINQVIKRDNSSRIITFSNNTSIRLINRSKLFIDENISSESLFRIFQRKREKEEGQTVAGVRRSRLSAASPKRPQGFDPGHSTFCTSTAKNLKFRSRMKDSWNVSRGEEQGAGFPRWVSKFWFILTKQGPRKVATRNSGADPVPVFTVSILPLIKPPPPHFPAGKGSEAFR